MDQETWRLLISVTGTIGAGSIAAITAVRISIRQQAHQLLLEREKRTIDKLEAAREELAKAENIANALHVTAEARISANETIHIDEFLKLTDIDRLEMLTDYHAPVIHPEVDTIKNEINAMVGAVLKANQPTNVPGVMKIGRDLQSSLATLLRCSKNVHEAVVKARQKLQIEAAKYHK